MVSFDLSTRNSQNFYFDWFLLCKLCNFWPKKYRGVIFHDTKESCKIWRKADLWFGKWHKENGKISPEHLKVSKLGLWCGPYIQSRKSMSLKFTEELCVMIKKKKKKIIQNLKRNWLVVSTLTWGISRILTQALKSFKYLHFNGFFFSKVKNAWA